ncbi:thioesterase family protein [Shewanella sp. YIC-542]|uniref:thioesterase family protein n=1 Tax=Shewanella mytili TaxID=3377111 RepID=UPI00398E4894
MNLYFRLFWMLLWRMRHARRIGFLEVSRLSFRAWPSDCDINLHLTNARYPALMDLARTFMLAEMGLLKAFWQRKWLPVVNASEFTFIRDIKPLSKFNIDTRVLGWDEKYFYIEQRFVSERGLHAIANVRGLFVCNGKKITIDALLNAVHYQGETPQLPDDVLLWKQLLQAKKQQNQ